MSRRTLVLTQFRSAQADPTTSTVKLTLSNYYEAEGTAPPGIPLPPAHETAQAVSLSEAMHFALAIVSEVDRVRDPKQEDYIENALMGFLELHEACLTGVEAAFEKGTPNYERYVAPRIKLVGILKYVINQYRGAPVDAPAAWARLTKAGG